MTKLGKEEDSTLPRDELLKTGGEFSVAELDDIGKWPEEIDPVSEHAGRRLRYVDDIVPTRLLPKSLLEEAKKVYEQTRDITQVIIKLWTSFYVYRETVNKSAFSTAPLIQQEDEIWEWPQPAEFEWGDETAATLAMLLGAYERQKGATISVTKGNIIHKLDVNTGTVSEEEVASLIAHPEQEIKYKIPVLEDVRMINTQAWQTNALREWAGRGKLASAFEDAINNKLTEKMKSGATEYFLSMIEVLGSENYPMPVLRYAREGEDGPVKHFAIFEL